MAKRGRPKLKATAKNRKKVRQMLAERIAIADIASVLELSVPTFRRLYKAELISGKKFQAEEEKKSSFQPTEVHRKKVVRHVACKTPIEDICRLIECTEDELRKHFADELATGRVRYRDKVLEDLETQSAAGTTSASNRLESLTALPSAAERDGSGASSAPAAHVVGKKAAARAQAAAAAAGGGVFAPPRPPRLVVNNNSGA